jgi:hypothetical protein
MRVKMALNLVFEKPELVASTPSGQVNRTQSNKPRWQQQQQRLLDERNRAVNTVHTDDTIQQSKVP